MAITRMRPSPQTPSHDGLKTLEEAAAYLKISPGTLKHWIAWRRIEHVKVGKLTRFRQSALDSWIAAHTVPDVPEP
jgi:excisionase family DNA binding protein